MQKTFVWLIVLGLTVVGREAWAAPEPYITAQPVSAVVNLGQPASLTVVAGGLVEGYQWLKDGVLLPGQTNSSLSLASFRFTDSGNYQVVVTGPGGLAISRPASLSVPGAPLQACGYNNFGQLGNGTTITTPPYGISSPISVASNVVAVAAGSLHSLLVQSDGTLWAMGANYFGQLGNGSTSNTNRPITVTSNVVAVAAGFRHSLFVRSNGTLWAMGRNDYGQLGLGNNSQQNWPVQVPGLTVASLARMSQAAHSLVVGGVYNLAGPITLTGMTKLGNGSVQFGFINSSGVTFTVLASTNVALPFAQWSILGAPVESPPGTYQFTDPQAPNYPRRFYRVRWP